MEYNFFWEPKEIAEKNQDMFQSQGFFDTENDAIQSFGIVNAHISFGAWPLQTFRRMQFNK